MMRETTFADILAAGDRLPLEDQENLINILQHRIREQRRGERVKDVREAQTEFAEGKFQPVTPEQLMEKIIS